MMLCQILKKHFVKPAKDEGGSAALQFAIVGPFFIALVIGTLEIGYALLVGTLLEAGAREASRYGITGLELGGKTRLEVIRETIATHTYGYVDMDALAIDTKVYENFSSIGKPEPYQDDNGNGSWDAGESYTDVNGNSSWDADLGVAGAGGGGDIVVYTLTHDQNLLTPFMQVILGGETLRRQARVVIRNEPF
jgi:Flp pilus assembly protein TadG